MKNIFKKVKVKVVAGSILAGAAVIYGGKKFIDYVSDFGDEPEPLTDKDIQNTLGIGGCCGITDEEKTGT